jgi:hypothetical protein
MVHSMQASGTAWHAWCTAWTACVAVRPRDGHSARACVVCKTPDQCERMMCKPSWCPGPAAQLMCAGCISFAVQLCACAPVRRAAVSTRCRCCKSCELVKAFFQGFHSRPDMLLLCQQAHAQSDGHPTLSTTAAEGRESVLRIGEPHRHAALWC